jgi:hypothetical protein
MKEKSERNTDQKNIGGQQAILKTVGNCLHLRVL